MWRSRTAHSVAAMRASVISAAVVFALLWAAPAAFGQAVTAVTVTTSPMPSRVGEPVQLSARVSVPQSPTTTPTGTLQFEVDGAAVGAPAAVVERRCHRDDRQPPGRDALDRRALPIRLRRLRGLDRHGKPCGRTVEQPGWPDGRARTRGRRSVGGLHRGREQRRGRASDGDRPIHRRGQLARSGRRSRSMRRASPAFSGSAGAGTYRVRAEYGGDGTFSASPRPSPRRSSARRRRPRSPARRTRPPSGAQIVFTIARRRRAAGKRGALRLAADDGRMVSLPARRSRSRATTGSR